MKKKQQLILYEPPCLEVVKITAKGLVCASIKDLEEANLFDEEEEPE